MSFQERAETHQGQARSLGEFLRRIGRDAQIIWAVRKAYQEVKSEERKDFLIFSVSPRLDPVGAEIFKQQFLDFLHNFDSDLFGRTLKFQFDNRNV